MTASEENTSTYKMTSLDQRFQDAIDVIQHHSNTLYYDSDYRYYESLSTQQSSLQCQISCCLVTHQSDIQPPVYDWNDTTQQSWPPVVSEISPSHSLQNELPHFYPILPSQRTGKGRKKLRLYEYLHEALNDPNMVDSIQWTDSGSGTFHFISKNKEKLAECWGQRKGNRKTMTYQKMARALRNYSRTGEIVKVRRKLTYQFNSDILYRLGAVNLNRQPPLQEETQGQTEQSYGSAAGQDWHGWYGHYQLHEDYDLASSFTSHIKL